MAEKKSNIELFNQLKESFRIQLDKAVSVEQCRIIEKELTDTSGGFADVIYDSINDDSIDTDKVLQDYGTLCYELANKFYCFGDSTDALKVIKHCRENYLDAMYSDALKETCDRLHDLNDRINKGPFVLPTSSTPLKPVPTPAQKPEPVNPKPTKDNLLLMNETVCQNCGTSNRQGAAFCKECGNDLRVNIPSEPKPNPSDRKEKPVSEAVSKTASTIIVDDKKNEIGTSDKHTETDADKEHNKNGNGKKPIPVKLIFLIVAVLVIAAGGYFVLGGKKGPIPPNPPSPPVIGQKEKAPEVEKYNISFDVPEGTKVVFDGKDVSGQKEIKVAAGTYDIQLAHQLFAFVYDKKISISKPDKIVPYKERKLKPDFKNIAEKASLAVMNELLQQACSSDSMKLNPKVFTANADANGKIAKAHRVLRNYATKNSLNQLPVELVSLGNLDLINKDKADFVKGTAEFSGTGANGRKINYSINSLFKIQGNDLLLDTLESISIKTQ